MNYFYIKKPPKLIEGKIKTFINYETYTSSTAAYNAVLAAEAKNGA